MWNYLRILCCALLFCLQFTAVELFIQTKEAFEFIESEATEIINFIVELSRHGSNQ